MATRLVKSGKAEGATSSKDRRRAHGLRTRDEILQTAQRLAAAHGLEALSIGMLADAVSISKAGLFAHFGSKEALQLATIELAHQTWLAEVIAPPLENTSDVPVSQQRMRRHFDYLARHGDQGGCFFTAASLEFDDRAGPVRDRLLALARERDALLEAGLRAAIKQGALPANTDLAQRMFEINAVTTGAAALFQLHKDPAILQRAQHALALLAHAHVSGAPATKKISRRGGK